MPPNATILDVGCGDGRLSQRIMVLRPDVQIEGVEVACRSASVMTVRHFDGRELPFPDATFDVAMLIDVVHHCVDGLAVLSEA